MTTNAATRRHPARLRGSALGVDSNVLAFAPAAAVAGVLLFAVPRRTRQVHVNPTGPQPEGAVT